ncbi:MAG: phospho-sugar mutase [Bacillota bacterium]|nr:phospho-sugar mutase [Bacillota bacterium]
MSLMYYENFLKWKNSVKDKHLLQELTRMDDKQIRDAFFKYIEFGTGGLRGKMAAGTNCINIYTIMKASQGVVDYMKAQRLGSVIIGYDNRNNSILFARISAQVFASNGIKVFITKELMPTPFISFAIRQLKTDMGIMITASHNPADYNGYKVYDNSGCQCTDNMAATLAKYIEKVDEFRIEVQEFKTLQKENKIEIVPDSTEEEYIENVLAQQINKIAPLNVTYSPLHGAGYRLVPKTLKKAGVAQINLVDEQSLPDGDFPTCKFPNPEKKEALALGLAYAEKNNSDILLVTDPDCDRVGVAVKHNGAYRLLSGNEVGALLADYILYEKKKKGILTKKPIVIKTIVTSDLGKLISEDFGAEVINVLTGFKYIGEQINILEQKDRSADFVLGFEESYGYLVGDYARDKDAVVACLLVAEMTASLLQKGKTLVDRLQEIYDKYGFFENRLYTYNFDGAQGHAKIRSIMQKLREDMPSSINSERLTYSVDYLTQTQFPLPKSNVLELNFEKGTKIIIRPSGTEPLIKVYASACQDTQKNYMVFESVKRLIEDILSAV